jgi:hypothetical protein
VGQLRKENDMRFVRKRSIDEKKYKVATVTQAIGRTEGSITGYFSSKNVSIKEGITMDQIEELLAAPTRGNPIDWNGVKEIRKNLEARGYEIDYSDENEFEF